MRDETNLVIVRSFWAGRKFLTPATRLSRPESLSLSVNWRRGTFEDKAVSKMESQKGNDLRGRESSGNSPYYLES